MNFLTIPARNDVPWYRFTIALSGVVYTLRFRFNVRMQRWILDIADSSNKNIIVGLPVLVSRNLFGRFVIDGLPPGSMFVDDLTNKDSQPGRFSFGLEHVLVYAEP